MYQYDQTLHGKLKKNEIIIIIIIFIYQVCYQIFPIIFLDENYCYLN